MSVFDEIDDLIDRSNTNVPQVTRRQKIELYSEGLKAKIKQVQFALDSINSFAEQSDQTISSTVPDDFLISDKIGFYCDSFWTFLYSSLDVLAQIINQTLKLNLNEKHVGFKAVENDLIQKHNTSNIQKNFTACKKSNSFKNLDAYRNCSTHRRQIYIKEEIKIVKHTAGYRTTTSGPLESVQRLMCDNPLDLAPRTSQQRKIPDYMEDTMNKLIKQIEKILKNTKPTR